MKKVNPIKPSEVAEEKQANIPNEVIDCFNKLIVKNMLAILLLLNSVTLFLLYVKQ